MPARVPCQCMRWRQLQTQLNGGAWQERADFGYNDVVIEDVGGNSNTFLVWGNSHPVLLLGSTADRASLGNGSKGIQNLGADVTLGGSPGFDSVDVNDQPDAAARSVTLDGSSSTGLGPGAAAVGVAGTSTSTNLVCAADAIINAGKGSVQSIQGSLNVLPGAGRVSLNVNDQHDTAAHNITGYVHQGPPRNRLRPGRQNSSRPRSISSCSTCSAVGASSVCTTSSRTRSTYFSRARCSVCRTPAAVSGLPRRALSCSAISVERTSGWSARKRNTV